MKKRFGSVCSGIEAASVAWHPLGWETAWVSEIEAFPCAVLAHHYPNTPNFGDMTKFKEWPNDPIDILVGGTPCQSFSVAGLRKGLADPRGNLMLTYLAIANRYRPKWIVWENVPGVLSSNKGKDFGTFLGALGELGYGFAYRVLDAQFFGVAQRRRRVFVVGYLGNWRSAAAVLFERESLRGDSAPSRKAGKGLAAAIPPSLTASGRDVERTGDTRGQDPVVAMCLNAGGMGRQDAESETLIAHTLRAQQGSEDGTGRGTPLVAQPAIMFEPRCTRTTGGQPQEELAHCLRADLNSGDGAPCVNTSMAVRRLTPRECERLQGFPDGYTAIPWRKKTAADCPDGPRYKALGNSMAVPVMRWIGQRIEMVEGLLP